MKIEGKLEGSLDIKIFYIDGIKMISNCPNCGKKAIFNEHNNMCLYYPNVNEPSKIDFECEDCDEEWSEEFILNISLNCK